MKTKKLHDHGLEWIMIQKGHFNHANPFGISSLQDLSM